MLAGVTSVGHHDLMAEFREIEGSDVRPDPRRRPLSDRTYRIDDLARAAATTVRNIRAYQERGLLDPPRRTGRIALYDDGHLARLRLILRLLERGVTLRLIGDLVDAWQGGHNIGELLGLERALLASGSDEADGVVPAEDLAALFGTDPDASDLDLAVERGLIRPEGDGYRVLQPRLIQIGTELAAMGVPVRDMLDHVGTLRERIDVIANDFVALAVEHVFRDTVANPAHADLDEVASLVERLRPLAKSVVDVELTRALDEAISTTIATTLGRD